MRFFRSLILASPLLAVPGVAMAYLDPATGSMILQGALAALFAGMFTLKVYWTKVSALFKRGPAEPPDEPPE